MVLYMASGPEFEKMQKMMKNSTPEQQKKGMDAWMKWMNANKASIVEGGAPLGKTERVRLARSLRTPKNEVCGYSVVQANHMMRPRRHSAKTILISRCPAHG